MCVNRQRLRQLSCFMKAPVTLSLRECRILSGRTTIFNETSEMGLWYSSLHLNQDIWASGLTRDGFPGGTLVSHSTNLMGSCSSAGIRRATAPLEHLILANFQSLEPSLCLFFFPPRQKRKQGQLGPSGGRVALWPRVVMGSRRRRAPVSPIVTRAEFHCAAQGAA